MAFIEQVTEKQIKTFYQQMYKKDTNTKTKTLSVEAELIKPGWFVKEMFSANHKLTGHSFLFCDFKVMYIPGSQKDYINEEARKYYEYKYIEFMKQNFGKEYENALLQQELETKLKRQKELDEEKRRAAMQKKIDETLKEITDEHIMKL